MVDIDRIDIWSTFGRLLVGSTLVDISRNDRPDQKWVVGSTLVDCKSTRPPALLFFINRFYEAPGFVVEAKPG